MHRPKPPLLKLLSVLAAAGLAIGAFSSAAAQQYLVIKKPKNGIQYAEIHTVRRTTEGAVAWVVEDLRHPDLLGHLSKLTIQEVDCKARRARVR